LSNPEVTQTETLTCHNDYDSSGNLLSTSNCDSDLSGWTEIDPQLVDYDCAETFSANGTQTGSCDHSYPVTNTYSNHRYVINNFFFLNTESKSYLGAITSESDANLMKNKGIYSWDQGSNVYWLCFCGDGNLSVTFAPNTSYLKYYDTSNTQQSVGTKKSKTVTISPSTHDYVQQSDGTYKSRWFWTEFS